ncbi:MAG: hypothetical protein ACXWB2_14160 [Acidimicrobiales bacterium]
MARRSVLLAGAGLAGTVLLAACGSKSSNADNSTVMSLEPTDTGDKASQLQAIFDFQNPYLVTGAPQRLTFGILGPDGSYTSTVPDTLSFQITKDGAATTPVSTVSSHTDGVPIGYFPLITTFDSPGNYQAVTTIDGKPSTQAFSVFEPSSTKLVPIGAKMVPVETPTVDDHRGVEPICTRPAGTCPFHTQTLTQALAAGKPTALLVSTPEFCQIGVCGLVLDLVIAAAAQHPEMQFVHAEVYTNAQAVKDLQAATLTPTVDAYGLTYEPSLYVADATGTIVDRLDYIFDATDLDASLSKAG